MATRFVGVSETRSRIMRAVRSKHTGPEKRVRYLLRKEGYRFGLHAKLLPGRPDFVIAPVRKAIFIHGCFWHQHKGCAKGRGPKTRADYWQPKLRRNAERDREAQRALRHLGWSVFVLWQCQLRKNEKAVIAKMKRFLGPPRRMSERRSSYSTTTKRPSFLVAHCNRRRP